MKKTVLCLTLAFLMILPLALSVTAADEATEPEADINDSLVTWWNFEGETEADTLKDKATNGQSVDDLTKSGTGTAVEDGIAYVPSAYENHLDMTAATADLTNVSSMTIYIKAKYTGNNVDFADLITYNGLYRIYKLKDSSSPAGAVIEASAFATKNNSDLGTVRVRPQSDGTIGIQQDEWFYVALTMEISEDNRGTAILYVSLDGLTYYKSETTMVFTEEILADLKTRQEDADAYVSLGKLTGETELDDRGISYWFDDVRIYDRVLTQTEIARIIPNSLELRDESELPVDPPETTGGDETTKTPSDDDTDAPSDDDTTAPSDSGTEAPGNDATEPGAGDDTADAGCQSVLGAGVVMGVLIPSSFCAYAITRKKRHNR